MKLISYWIDLGNSPKKIHTDDGMVLIIGYYNHKNQHAKGEKALGVHLTKDHLVQLYQSIKNL